MAEPKDRVDLTDEEFDDAQAMTHASSIQHGMQRAIAHIRQIAGVDFQRGDDQTAKMLRRIAQDLEEQAERVYTAPDLHTGATWQGEGKSNT